MIEVVLPISHLVENDPGLAGDLWATADWAEYKFPRPMALPPGLRRAFHWNRGLIEHDFESATAEVIDFLGRQRIELFSFDLGPACARSQFILPLSETLSEDEIFRTALQRLRFISDNFSGRLAVENYNYYPTGLYEHVCHPEFIARFLTEFDLGLVLDLGHALVTAANLGFEVWDYLARLPLELVVEVHLSRPYFHPRLAVDAHLAPAEAEFELLAGMLQRLPQGEVPVLVAIEYFQTAAGIKQAYAELIARLADLSGTV